MSKDKTEVKNFPSFQPFLVKWCKTWQTWSLLMGVLEVPSLDQVKVGKSVWVHPPP